MKDDKNPIKFRARELETGKWCYGVTMIAAGEHCFVLDDFGTCAPHPGMRHIRHVEMYAAPCDRSTLGRYTGLKDSNGRDIYEGDIVMIHTNSSSISGVPVAVVWNEHHGWWAPQVIFTNPHISIIGNVHENPDLVNGYWNFTQKRGGEEW